MEIEQIIFITLLTVVILALLYYLFKGTGVNPSPPPPTGSWKCNEATGICTFYPNDNSGYIDQGSCLKSCTGPTTYYDCTKITQPNGNFPIRNGKCNVVNYKTGYTSLSACESNLQCSGPEYFTCNQDQGCESVPEVCDPNTNNNCFINPSPSLGFPGSSMCLSKCVSGHSCNATNGQCTPLTPYSVNYPSNQQGGCSQNTCPVVPGIMYSCGANGQCVQDPNGNFTSLSACNQSCCSSSGGTPCGTSCCPKGQGCCNGQCYELTGCAKCVNGQVVECISSCQTCLDGQCVNNCAPCYSCVCSDPKNPITCSCQSDCLGDTKCCGPIQCNSRNSGTSVNLGNQTNIQCDPTNGYCTWCQPSSQARCICPADVSNAIPAIINPKR